MEFANENLNEGELVAADRVDVVGETVNVRDADVDSESADNCPLRLGWEAVERGNE
ncbi:MAG: hypothetical protein OXN44_00355 [Acidimicrobiaceae bacterium]|nr:hypothetical protein [Acidimicrobiaceae bacterium]MDE0606822.1 hypothetical protein [Acidimicrobiaceae bacterium]